MEGDDIVSHRSDLEIIFQSTPSAWRETPDAQTSHAVIIHFNPLPPHGGRHTDSDDAGNEKAFQSTPSAWRETLAEHSK